VLFILDLPLSAGDFKITPEVTTVLLRNNNMYVEKADHEFLVGMSLDYKINPALALSAHTAYGTIGNTSSGLWGEGGSESDIDNGLTFTQDVRNGLIMGIGTTVAAGPGAFAFDFKFGSSWNSATKIYYMGDDDNLSSDAKKQIQLDDRSDILLDVSYGWNVHPKFQIKPRWRLFYSSWDTSWDKDKNQTYISSKMENRPELIITGTF